jgi:Domain of unknown function/Glycosyl hydrolase-like 10
MNPRFEPSAPLPTLPGIMIDSELDAYGIAHQTARNRRIQARILWIDATANVARYNSAEKIKALVQKIADVGFNTIVLDIKPISGQVIFPSKFAPKLLEWRKNKLPAEFDPVKVFSDEAKSKGLSLIASLNAFSEGHRLFKVGPGYEHPERQSIIYEPIPYLESPLGERTRIKEKVDKFDPEMVSVVSSAAKLPKLSADSAWLILNGSREVIKSGDTNLPKLENGETLLYGTGKVADFLRKFSGVGTKFKFESEAEFVPMAKSSLSQYPLMMNPNNPAEWEYELNIVQEVVKNYSVDGVIYDDRLRYAGIEADFSLDSQEKFERVIGHKLKWPDDVLKITFQPNLSKGLQPGKYYDQWLAWRSYVLREFLREVRVRITKIRPSSLLGMYVGSWYGEYPALGNNYASPEADPGFWFFTRNYRQMGSSSDVDFVVPGCYYTLPTVYDSLGKGATVGTTVEAAGRLVDRLVRDQAWTYAGLSLQDFKGNMDGLKNCLQAACSSTEGVMVFDLSHDIESAWPTFAQAFSQRANPPHKHPELLVLVREQRAAIDRLGKRESSIKIAAGAAGIGQ